MIDTKKLKKVVDISNDAESNITLFFEPRCEEIVVAPKESLEILADGKEEEFPVDIIYSNEGLQIYSKSGNAEWFIKKNGITKSTMEIAYGIT